MALKRFLVDILRIIIPKKVRQFLWSCVPRIKKINTFVLIEPMFIHDKVEIDESFVIREVGKNDIDAIKQFHNYRGSKSFDRKVPQRLNSSDFVGLAAIDKETSEIAYLSWIIINSIPYFEEFGFIMEKGDYLVKDIFVVPKYRHRGLSTRMEQERINFCVLRGGKRIYTQPLNINNKGNEAYLRLGYIKLRSNYLIQWPIFNVWRELYSFLKNPFKKVIK